MSLSDIVYNIRHAVYAKKVREAIASAIEEISNKEDKNLEIYNNMVIGAGESNAEIVDARLDNNTGVRYEKVGKRLDKISSQIAEFENEVDTIVANVTNGNESATNSEIVAARLGYTALSTINRYLKENIDKINSEIYEDIMVVAKEDSFEGTCSAKITNEILSAYNINSKFSYLSLDTDKLEFEVKDSSYLLLGENNEGFVTIQIKTKSGIDGGINTWLENEAGTVIARNVITSDFVDGDICKIEYDINKKLWSIYKNGNLHGSIFENSYNLNLTRHFLGFHVSNPDSLTSIDNLAKALKIREYNKSKIEVINKTIENINLDLTATKKATYIESKEYSDTLTTTEVTDFLNSGGLTIEEGILSKPTAPSSTLYPLQLQTNKIEFNIQKSDIIMLSGDRKGKFICLWLKHDTKPDMTGKLAVCTYSNASTKYTFDIEACKEGDLINATIDEEKVILTKNNKEWLTINKNKTPLINWDKDIYNLGILCTSEKNINLCSNLKHNKLIEKDTPVNEALINTKKDLTNTNKTLANINKIFTELKIVSKWKGKKVAIIADSIGAGYGNTGYDLTTKTGGYSWIDSLSKTLEFGEVARHCKGGAMVSNWFIDEVDNIAEDTDLIISMGGFNDYGQNVPIGTISDIDNTTFYGALNIFYQKLINKFPTKTILIITPLHANNNTWNGKSDGTQNTAGHILNDYRLAEINRCEKYSLPYIDGFSLKLNPNIQALKDLYFNDGVHPNEVGDDELGGNILPPKINTI